MKHRKKEKEMVMSDTPVGVEKIVVSLENDPILPEIIPEPKDPFPDRPTLRIGEVADYYDVTDRTVRLWIENGHLKTEFTPGGQLRITKDSVNACRFSRKDRKFINN
jgi:excisionase family DNA binding protein